MICRNSGSSTDARKQSSQCSSERLFIDGWFSWPSNQNVSIDPFPCLCIEKLNYDYNTIQNNNKHTFISMLPRFSNLKPPTSSKYCLVFSDT